MTRLNYDPKFKASIPIRRGIQSPAWKGGKCVKGDGIVLIFAPWHPNAFKSGYLMEHVLVASQALGRPLKRGEIVHHLDTNKANNKSNNLLVCTQSYHIFLHHRMGSFQQSRKDNKS
jgi:hypothetical protein